MRGSRTRLRLLPSELLVKTGPVDHADWNYRPLLGRIQRMRFKLVCSLLADTRFARLLEIGYGSGVFLPELATRCEELHGLDLHERPSEVTRALDAAGVSVRLASGSVTGMPYPDEHFDCIVSVSAIEYVEDIDGACRELRRVLRPGGEIVLVTPGFSPLIDLGLRMLTGESARANYARRREALPRALEENFTVLDRRVFPPFGGRILRLYAAFRLTPRRPFAPAGSA